MNIPLNIDWQQILLHLFNFVILAGGLYFILYKPTQNPKSLTAVDNPPCRIRNPILHILHIYATAKCIRLKRQK